MTETCPTCAGERITDDPDRLADYVHEARCALALAERETWDEDRARHRRYGTAVRHRAATQGERILLAASGVRVPEGECFTRVEWQDGVRTRAWRRQPVVSVTESPHPARSHTPLGGTPLADDMARTDREAAPGSAHAPLTGFPRPAAAERP